MNKFRIIFVTLLSLIAASAHSQTVPYSITAMGEYAYNTTYGHQSGLDLLGYLPVSSHFDISPALQTSTANVHTAAVQARALFPLGPGDLYLKNRIIFRAVARSGMYDLSAGLSLGYDWDYVEAEFGMFSRFVDTFGRDIHSTDETLCEPFNLLYRIEGRLRPKTSRWNAVLSVSNADLFQLERMWQPIFSLGGRYSITERVGLRLDAVLKPAGMFHLNAEFYSIAVRAGATITF